MMLETSNKQQAKYNKESLKRNVHEKMDGLSRFQTGGLNVILNRYIYLLPNIRFQRHHRNHKSLVITGGGEERANFLLVGGCVMSFDVGRRVSVVSHIDFSLTTTPHTRAAL